MKMKLIEKPTVEVRGDEAVVIFPSRPYWFSATKEIATILDAFQIKEDKETIIRFIASNLEISLKESLETFNEVKDLLYSNGVLTIEGKISNLTEDVEPSFQVNNIENVLVISATQGCNLTCHHCYANARKPLRNEMTTEELKRIIKNLESMPWKNDISRVGLTGGEFFTRSDAMKIIDYVHARGFHLLISSNGLLLNEDIILRLANYTNLKISISLDGPNAEIHEFIRGKGTFKKTIKAIQMLSEKGIFVGVNMFVHQGNVDSIKETIQLSERLGVKSFNCLNLMQVGRANTQLSQDSLTRVPDHILYKKLFNILKDNYQYQELMENSTFANQIMGIAGGIKSHYCGIGTNRALYIRADGNVYPCPDTAIPEFYLGNVLENGQLWNIWQNSPLLDKLRHLDVDTMNSICMECDVRYFCGGGCRGENYQVTGEIKNPHFNCKEIRKTIIEMMWMLTENPEFFQNKVESLYQKVCF